MDYKFKAHFAAVYKMLEGEESGTIEVKASSYGNEDVYGDVFVRGAFADDISRISRTAKLPMLFNHDPSRVIGHWYQAWDDSEFLYMRGRLSLGHSLADDIHINLKNGDIGGVSIGFNSDDATERRDDKGRYEGMTFNKVRLMENSIVTFPANERAEVDSVKSITQQRQFEKELIDAARDAGVSLSRRDVEKLSKSVWPKLGKNIERDADALGAEVATDDIELIEAIKRFSIKN